MTVTWLPSEFDQPPRIAYAVGRRVGRAVVRNRLRRRLRSVLREAEELPPGAYLVAASAEASGLSYEELKSTVGEALTAVTERQTPKRRGPR